MAARSPPPHRLRRRLAATTGVMCAAPAQPHFSQLSLQSAPSACLLRDRAVRLIVRLCPSMQGSLLEFTNTCYDTGGRMLHNNGVCDEPMGDDGDSYCMENGEPDNDCCAIVETAGCSAGATWANRGNPATVRPAKQCCSACPLPRCARCLEPFCGPCAELLCACHPAAMRNRDR